VERENRSSRVTGSEDFQVNGYAISNELFDSGMKAGEGPCRCNATCCLGGVYADLAERDTILRHREIVRKYMDETQPTSVSMWFEDYEFEDGDFPSGRCVGTREYNDKCAFLDKHGRCTAQVAATEEGMHRWALKPLYCVLFPIEITGKTIRFDDLLQGDVSCCSLRKDFDVPLFEVCRDELTYLLGEAGFSRIREHYQSIQREKGGGSAG
jgi:hypothetical protein